ncbi:hemoglobin subunit beta-like isoform X2 [Pleurodeles waltl]|uniref:hemoglobin subunit beta-like isoform X2 n=1 Tax=Pleurodeles waltl TaxID=8319 RepID=UPI003709612D
MALTANDYLALGIMLDQYFSGDVELALDKLLVVFPWTIGFLRDYPDVSNTRMAAPNSSLATEMQNVLSEATKNLENPPEFKKNLPKFKGVFEKLHNLRTNKMP